MRLKIVFYGITKLGEFSVAKNKHRPHVINFALVKALHLLNFA